MVFNTSGTRFFDLNLPKDEFNLFRVQLKQKVKFDYKQFQVASSR